MEGAGGSMTGVERLDSGRRRSDDAGPLSMTVLASTKREEASEIRDEMEKRDLFDKLFILNLIGRCLKTNKISSHWRWSPFLLSIPILVTIYFVALYFVNYCERRSSRIFIKQYQF